MISLTKIEELVPMFKGLSDQKKDKRKETTWVYLHDSVINLLSSQYEPVPVGEASVFILPGATIKIVISKLKDYHEVIEIKSYEEINLVGPTKGIPDAIFFITMEG